MLTSNHVGMCPWYICAGKYTKLVYLYPQIYPLKTGIFILKKIYLRFLQMYYTFCQIYQSCHKYTSMNINILSNSQIYQRVFKYTIVFSNIPIRFYKYTNLFFFLHSSFVLLLSSSAPLDHQH